MAVHVAEVTDRLNSGTQQGSATAGRCGHTWAGCPACLPCPPGHRDKAALPSALT